MLGAWIGGEVHSEGLVLRPWREQDVPTMVSLFNTQEMDRWTPLAHPFDEPVAREYVAAALEARERGTLQLAVTEDGGEPLGEVLLFGTDEDGTCEFAYAIGQPHRGRALAARSVLALLPAAATAGHKRARMLIAIDNLPSQHVASAAAFTLAADPLVRRERKGYVLDLATWRRDL
jgi:RimJ/RimL family protein N-acetyltransferase